MLRYRRDAIEIAGGRIRIRTSSPSIQYRKVINSRQPPTRIRLLTRCSRTSVAEML
jgi:hypothetical protein